MPRRDPDTGEFHRVTFDGGGEGRLISTETYNDRVTKRLLIIQQARKHLVTAVVGFSVAAWAWHSRGVLLSQSDILEHPRGPSPLFDMMLYEHSTFQGYIFWTMALLAGGCVFLGAGFEWLVCGFRLASRAYDAGPRPIPPPGLEEVERQKVHGVGGFAGRSAIDRAARGSARNGADQLTFND